MKQMQNTDYEYLKKRIKDMEPAVENPEELTRSILDKIMELSVRKKTDKRLLFTTWQQYSFYFSWAMRLYLEI